MDTWQGFQFDQPHTCQDEDCLSDVRQEALRNIWVLSSGWMLISIEPLVLFIRLKRGWPFWHNFGSSRKHQVIPFEDAYSFFCNQGKAGKCTKASSGQHRLLSSPSRCFGCQIAAGLCRELENSSARFVTYVQLTSGP